MKIFIGFSVNAVNGEAVGSVNGEIDCCVEPLIGDAISFMSTPDGQVAPVRHKHGWSLKVTQRTIQPGHEKAALILSLEDMILETREQAVAIMNYMANSYGLNMDIYE